MNEPTSVAVRMYRNLLGDCFLIRLEGEQARSHILIDCGLLQGVAGAKETLTAIAEDIETTTGGRIDLLVITHEHWDHIGGFSLARDILLDPQRLRYDKVWMAWTEDPDDAQATELRQRLADRKAAIARVSLALAGTNQLDALTQDLAKFIGPIEGSAPAFGAAPQGRLTGGRIMEELKKTAPRQFLAPGAVLETPGTLSLPVAVLGPPRSLARLKKDLPTEGAGKETYFGEEFLAFSLLGIEGSSGEAQLQISSPFSKRYRVSLSASDADATAAWEKEVQGTTKKWLYDHYFASEDDTRRPQSYRRIDEDWTEAASSLALKLDSDTNNTSLVLAFRLPDQSFLLFAADAQVGNWLSWHDQPYAFDDKSLTASQILERTRLYKVGHHGSHNATLKEKGLELMTHDQLVSMVSTIEEVAKEQGTKGWQMPDADVKSALLEHCDGRVIRGDRLWAEDKDVAAWRDQPDFVAALDESSPLFVELRVYPPGKKEGRADGKAAQRGGRRSRGRARPAAVSRTRPLGRRN